MKFINCGKKYGDMEVAPKSQKEKVSYPELRLEKDIGDIEVGDEIVIVAKVKVSGIRSDEYGDSTTLQVKKIAIKNAISNEDKIRKVVDKIDLY